MSRMESVFYILVLFSGISLVGVKLAGLRYWFTCVLSFLFLCTCTLNTVLILVNLNNEPSTFYVAGSTNIIGIILCISSAQFCSFWFRKRIRELADLIETIEIKNNSSFWTLKPCSVALSIVYLILIGVVYSSGPIKLSIVSHFASNFMVFVFRIHLCNLAINLRSHFRRVNDRLFYTLGEINDIELSGARDGKRKLKLLDFTFSYYLDMHRTLCEILKQINAIYGLLLLSLMINSFTQLVTSLHSLLVSFLFGTISSRITKKCIKFDTRSWGLWCTSSFFQLIIVVWPFHWLSHEIQRVEEIIINHLSVTPRGAYSRSQVNSFLYQLMDHRKTKLTGAGMLKIDMKIITKMASAITVYLTILLQFQKKEDCEE